MPSRPASGAGGASAKTLRDRLSATPWSAHRPAPVGYDRGGLLTEAVVDEIESTDVLAAPAGDGPRTLTDINGKAPLRRSRSTQHGVPRRPEQRDLAMSQRLRASAARFGLLGEPLQACGQASPLFERERATRPRWPPGSRTISIGLRRRALLGEPSSPGITVDAHARDHASAPQAGFTDRRGATISERRRVRIPGSTFTIMLDAEGADQCSAEAGIRDRPRCGTCSMPCEVRLDMKGVAGDGGLDLADRRSVAARFAPALDQTRLAHRS